MRPKAVAALARFRDSLLIFAPLNFFFFVVGRYSAGFAPPGRCKSFAGCKFVSGGGAKLPEFRPGGAAKFFPGGAKFVRHFEADASDVQKSPHILLDI
jgi:hypothetical protein